MRHMEAEMAGANEDQGQQAGQQPQQGQPAGQQSQQPGDQGGTSWEQVLATLPEEQRGLYEQHTQGLRSALQSERTQRGDLARQLREATAGMEEGSAARTQLEQVGAQLEDANRRADFAMDAGQHGVVNARLAYLAAVEVEAFDRRGNVNWERLREQFPELFRTNQVPAGNAGNGTGTPPPAAGGMNAFIRQQAGKG